MTKIVNGYAETVVSSKEKATFVKVKHLTKKKSGVLSVNRGTEDVFCENDEASSHRSSKLYKEDIYDFGSSPVASPIESHQKQKTPEVEVLSKSSERCYKELVQWTKKTVSHLVIIFDAYV